MRRLAVAAGAAASAILALLVAAQLVLPGIAAQRLSARLSRSGRVLSVSVSAFPAIELLWHRADRVVVRLATYRPPLGSLGGALAQAGDVGTLYASALEVDYGLLRLRHAMLVKRGDTLAAAATVTESDLRTAVPILRSVTPLASPEGTLTLRGTATLLGLTARVDATVAARDGSLVIAPDVPFGGLATLTLFSSPHVRVASVGASPVAGGFRVRAGATLH